MILYKTNYIDRQKIITDAQTAESNDRYCLAAILWRRIKEFEEANMCEEIASAIAQNNISDKLK